jgi:hypothetical protein
MKNSKLPAVQTVSDDIFEIRGRRVILDARVAEAFGLETKRINEAVARNPEKFSDEHGFKLTEEEHEALRSQIATSTGRGGARYAPSVYTMKGVARLATVLSSDAALRATDMIIDTFLRVYEQASQGKAVVAIKDPARYAVETSDRQAAAKFRKKLHTALEALLDSVIDIENQTTVRKAGQTLVSEALHHMLEGLRTKGLENMKLEADTRLVLAEAEKILAEARKLSAESQTIDLGNLEKRIAIIRNLLQLSREIEPVEFMSLLDRFDHELPQSQTKAIAHKKKAE